MTPDWTSIRAGFPALAEWTYLNTATFGQMPVGAQEAMTAHLARRDRFACADFMQWFDDADRIRGLAARLVHCAPEDIAFIPNASAGLSLLLGGMEWKPGDRIVTLADEFPNQCYYPSWLGRRGVDFVEAPYDRFYEAITPATRLVVLSTVSYMTGFRPPLDEIAPFLRARGVRLFVDGTQSVGALEFDVSRVQPDLLAVHGYKWLLSPNGAGFMYVSPGLRATLDPNVIGWRSDRRWRDPENLHHGVPEFAATAEKYEGGMIAFALLYAMGAVIEMLLEIGPAAIERRVQELAALTRKVLRDAGADVRSDHLSHHDSPIVAARFAGQDVRTLVRDLRTKKVLVAARQRNLRVSPHFYNDESDIERFGEALADLGLKSRTSLRTPPGSSPLAG